MTMAHIVPRTFVILLLFSIFLTSFFGCQDREPIKIGFSSGLTGRLADLGTYGRNGTILAVEEVNNQGGINGRLIELLVQDDKQDPEVAKEVDRKLIEDGVVAIIGHMTSSMSVTVAPLINKNNVLLFSPTTATDALTGIDDNFLRLMPPNRVTITALAQHVYKTKGIGKTVVVYDDQNRAFSKEWADLFARFAESRDASSVGIPFISGPDFSFEKLSGKILSHKPQGVIIVAAALDAAMICQQIRKVDTDISLFTTMWAMNEDFLQHGGNSTEGVSFINWFDPEHPSPASQNFQKRYLERFGRKPTFASHFAYETTNILLDALHQTDNPVELKQAILQKGEYMGTQGQIKIDKYGDAERSLFLMTVVNNQFVRVL